METLKWSLILTLREIFVLLLNETIIVTISPNASNPAILSPLYLILICLYGVRKMCNTKRMDFSCIKKYHTTNATITTYWMKSYLYTSHCVQFRYYPKNERGKYHIKMIFLLVLPKKECFKRKIFYIEFPRKV